MFQKTKQPFVRTPSHKFGKRLEKKNAKNRKQSRAKTQVNPKLLSGFDVFHVLEF